VELEVRSWVVCASAQSWLLFTDEAFAHPASGIVVNARGEVFFVHTGA
jgi:hypothetical protein